MLERIRTEQETRRLQDILDRMTHGARIIGFDWRYIYLNDAASKQSRRTKGDLLGHTMMELFPGIDQTPLFNKLQRCMEQRTPQNFENTFTFPDKSTGYFDLSVQAVAQGIFILSKDISERRQLQVVLLDKEKLESALGKELELSSLKTRMMERIAHEFRTPLTIIQTSVETLTHYHDRFTPEQREVKRVTIRGQIRRIAAMLDEISLVVNGSFTPESVHRVSTDVSALCREIATDLKANSGLPNEYQLDLPQTTWVRLDPSVLRNAIKHIMGNAARFSKLSADVSVRLVRLETAIELRVTNSGIGILPDDLPHIFEPFFRGSDIGEVSGLGVGLTVTHAAIEAHGGSITIESVVGQGATVTIWIPV